MTAFGLPRLHLRLTDSTNERARGLAQAGAPSGTVVTADEQSAGRGRRGRVWSAPAGAALLFSAILRPLGPEHALLPLAVPLAVCEAIESLGAASCAVKWPNDVWIERRKVAGVLIEARPPDWAVIGVGINLAIRPEDFPADLRWPAASIDAGASVDDACAALAGALGEWVDAPEQRVLTGFGERDALDGERVAWEGAASGPGTGTAAGIDARGNLLVEADDGERLSLGSGEVSLRPGTRSG